MVMELNTKENLEMNGMTEGNIVLDTNAVIFLTTQGKIIPDNLQDQLNKADLYISVITEIELFAKPGMPSDEEEKLHNFIEDKILVVDLTNEIKNEIILLRRSTKLKLPDSIIAATSIILNAVLFTNDDHLLNLS